MRKLIIGFFVLSFHYLTIAQGFNPGFIGNNQKIPPRTAPVTLFFITGPSGGATPYSYQWQRSTDLGVTYSDLAGATLTVYSPIQLTRTTLFRCSVTDANAITDNTNAVTITVWSVGVIGNNQTIPIRTAPEALRFTTLPSGGASPYSYQWQRSIDLGATYSDVSGATLTVFSPPQQTRTTLYRCRVTEGDNFSNITNPVTITVLSGIVAGTIGNNQTICYNTAPALLTGPVASGGTPPYSYQWQYSTNGSSWSNLTGATSTGYTPGALTIDTWYRRWVGDATNRALASNTVKITVNPQIASAQLNDNITIEENTSANFNVVISGGTTPYTVNYTRNGIAQPAINNYVSGTDISTGILTGGVYTYTLTSVTDANGCAAQSIGSNITVTVISNLNSGTIGNSQTICYNTIPAPLTEITAPTGGTGEYIYQWQSSPNNSLWTDISGATLSRYSPSALSIDTYFRREVTSGTYTPVYSTPVLISLFPQISSAQLHDNKTIGYGSSTNFNVFISGGTSPYLINYTRNGVAQTPVSNYSSGADISTGPLLTGIYTYSITSVTDANGCITTQNLGTEITITVIGYWKYEFTYADRGSLLADGWDFIARTSFGGSRDTEQTTGAVVSYDQQAHPGVLRIPVDAGLLWATSNNTLNTIFRDLPSDWTSVRLKVASFAPYQVYQQAGLAIYQDDDNYVQVCRREGDSHYLTFASEVGGNANNLRQRYETGTANFHFRLDREIATETITSYYSLDGSDWYLVGSVAQSLSSPRLAIVTGGSPNGYPNADIEWAEVEIQPQIPIANKLHAYPQALVYNSVQDQSLSDSRTIYLFTTLGNNINWTLSSDVTWLIPSLTNGVTDGTFEVSVNTGGLTAGLHYGNITIVPVEPGLDPIIVPVTLIINPDVPVKTAIWRDDKAGAMSVSIDNDNPTSRAGFDALVRNGFQGTYVYNGTVPPSFYTDFYNAGMELGSHLVDHTCYYAPDNVLRHYLIEPSIQGISTYTPMPQQDVISLVWPCGYTNYREQAVASEYFLSARGYLINQLEDATPQNFMNLKSFNSHEHYPYPPYDFKTIVDEAIVQKKWFNLVLHNETNENGAIDYAKNQDIWTTGIGTVIKYILQRDRFILTDYITSENITSFKVSRLSIPSSVYRSFETSFGANDITTLQIDVDDRREIESISVAGTVLPYQTKVINGNTLLITNVLLESAITKTVEIRYAPIIPQVYVNISDLSFVTTEGGKPESQSFAISSLPENLTWTVVVGSNEPYWLDVTPASGSGNGTVIVSVNSAGLAIGNYSKTISVVAPEASNSPRVINVNLRVNAEGVSYYDFAYADRSSLLADGWDFIARTSSGGSRDTEQTAGAVVSYNQLSHPGVIRIPVDRGDLWGTSGASNNTRNTLFRDLPSGWTSVRLKISSFAPVQDYQQAGLLVYQNDDNYVQICRIFGSGNIISFVRESGGNAGLLNSAFEIATVNLHLRLDRDIATETITSYYSLDGSNWNLIGSIVQSLNNPRLAIMTGSSPSGFPNADFDWVEILSSSSKSDGSEISTPKTVLESLEVLPELSNKLYQNYPNPFSSGTCIEYDLAYDGYVMIEIFNSFGLKLETVQNQFMKSGKYRLIWDSSVYPSGIYYLTMKAGIFRSTIKMSLLK